MTSATADTLSSNSTGAVPAKVGLGAIVVPVLLSTVLTLGVVGGGLFWLIRSGRLATSGVAAGVRAVAATPVVSTVASHVVALDPMVVNLADSAGRSYLRTAVSLRLRNEEVIGKKEDAVKDPKAVDGAAAALRDTTLIVLSRETADSLLEPDGREVLKKKLDEQYKVHNPDTHVLEIYFTDFLVQRG